MNKSTNISDKMKNLGLNKNKSSEVSLFPHLVLFIGKEGTFIIGSAGHTEH